MTNTETEDSTCLHKCADAYRLIMSQQACFFEQSLTNYSTIIDSMTMNSADLEQALLVANKAADAGESTIKSHEASGSWSVSYKADDSPVTEVDVATEKAIHAVLAEHSPNAAFYGEETGHTAAASASPDQHLWLVDPIDGTKSFIRNMPFYSTQIALSESGELCVGVSNAPAYGERLIARTGGGAWLNGEQVHCRKTHTLSEAFLSTGNLNRLAKNAVAWTVFGEIITKVRRVRGYGDFCHYHQLCCGQTDLIIESDVNILDIAALTVGVREAGGVITDLNGGAVGLETTSVLAAGTMELHEEVLGLLGGVFG